MIVRIDKLQTELTCSPATGLDHAAGVVGLVFTGAKLRA